jgi:hypothetical protein
VPRYDGLGTAPDAATEAGIGFTVDWRTDTTTAPGSATGAGWGEPRQRPRTIALIAWPPHVKGALRCFATVLLPVGLKLIDSPVLASNGRAWVNLPEGPVLDRDSCHKIGADGKRTSVAICEWRSRALSDRFSEAVNEEFGG